MTIIYDYKEKWLHHKCSLWVFLEFLKLLQERHVVKPLVK